MLWRLAAGVKSVSKRSGGLIFDRFGAESGLSQNTG